MSTIFRLSSESYLQRQENFMDPMSLIPLFLWIFQDTVILNINYINSFVDLERIFSITEELKSFLQDFKGKGWIIKAGIHKFRSLGMFLRKSWKLNFDENSEIMEVLLIFLILTKKFRLNIKIIPVNFAYDYIDSLFKLHRWIYTVSWLTLACNLKNRHKYKALKTSLQISI